MNVAASPDGSILATGTHEGKIVVSDARTFERIGTLDGAGVADCFAFSSDTRLLAAGNEREVIVWELPRPEPIRRLAGHDQRVSGIAFCAERLLASAGHDQTLRLWNLDTGAELAALRGHEEQITDLTCAPGGRTLATASSDATVILWDAAAPKPRNVLKNASGHPLPGRFSLDGKFLATATTGTNGVVIWDVEKAEPHRILPDEWYPWWFLPDGKSMLTVKFENPGQLAGPPIYHATTVLALNRWDFQTSTLLDRIPLSRPVERVVCGALSPDGTAFVTGNKPPEKKVIHWDAKTGEQIRTVAEATEGLLVVTFSPDGKKLAWTTFGEARIVEWPSLKPVAEVGGTEQHITTTAFSPDGTMFAVPGKDNTVRLWTLNPRKEVILPAHKAFVFHLAVSMDGKTLATATVNQVKLWSVATHRELLTFENSLLRSFVKFSPDGRTLAAGSRKGIQLWRAPSWEEFAAETRSDTTGRP